MKVQPYAFKPTEAPVAPEGYIAPKNEDAEYGNTGSGVFKRGVQN